MDEGSCAVRGRDPFLKCCGSLLLPGRCGGDIASLLVEVAFGWSLEGCVGYIWERVILVQRALG